MDIKRNSSCIDKITDIGELVDYYFSPSEIEGKLECDKCSKMGISKVLKYIFKLPKTLLLSFLDFKSLIRNEESNFIKFKPFRELNLNKYIFKNIQNKNTNEKNIIEITDLNILGKFLSNFLFK